MNLQFLTGLIESGLVHRLDCHQVVGLQNGVAGVEGLGLGRGVSADGEARVLAERGGAWDGEEVAVESDGGGEEGREFEERREREEGDGATVAIGHDALDRTVVGDAGVAELEGLGHELCAG